MSDSNNVVMEEVRIIFRNFAGKESEFNREGDRNFAVLLDDRSPMPCWRMAGTSSG
jgi:hypothetical protein